MSELELISDLFQLRKPPHIRKPPPLRYISEQRGGFLNRIPPEAENFGDFHQFSVQKSFRNGSKTHFWAFGAPQGPKMFACGAKKGPKSSILGVPMVEQRGGAFLYGIFAGGRSKGGGLS